MTDLSTPSIPPDGHAGDLVSARLDGELDDATAAWVEDHLAVCESCREVAGAVRAAREWMRTAPPVDATPVVGGVIARRRRMVGNGLVFVGLALFVSGILAVTASVSHPTVLPPVEDFVAAHARAAHGDVEGVRPVDRSGSHYATPLALNVGPGALERLAVYDGADLTMAVYADGSATVTVYQQPGRVDWDELPAGHGADIGGRRAWTRPGTPTVVVTEIGDLTVTLVADDDEQAEGIVAALDAPERTSTIDRVHDSCQRLMAVFALGG